jgi:hypothetical protein
MVMLPFTFDKAALVVLVRAQDGVKMTSIATIANMLPNGLLIIGTSTV